MRQQITKVLDHLRSELESLEFSNASIELTMAALQTIQDRHPPAPSVERGAPLTRAEIAEYMKLKREHISPGNSIFAIEGEYEWAGSEGADEAGDLDMDADGEDAANDSEMEPEARDAAGHLNMEREGADEVNDLEMGPHSADEDETRSIDSGTDISSTGLNNILPSERNIDDDEPHSESLGPEDSEDSDATTMSSQGFSLASTPAVRSALQTPRQAGVSTNHRVHFRGPVKLPSRLRPMPYAPASLQTSTSTSKSTKSNSSSPIIATSPVPQVTKSSRNVQAPRKLTGPPQKSTLLPLGGISGAVLDLTVPMPSGNIQEVIELETSPLSSVPTTLESTTPRAP